MLEDQKFNEATNAYPLIPCEHENKDLCETLHLCPGYDAKATIILLTRSLRRLTWSIENNRRMISDENNTNQYYQSLKLEISRINVHLLQRTNHGIPPF